MKTNVSNLYLNWLFNTVKDKEGWKLTTHKKLLCRLHRTPFLVQDPNDQPRENDGIDLRWRFAWECGHVGDELIYIDNFNDERCSILEMMVSLALRADENFYKTNNDETTVAFLFWNMIKNMGLLNETDNVYDDEMVVYKLDKFNNRMYDINGDGGLFMFPHNHTEDFRNVDIWTQLCWWVNENFTW